MAVHTRQFSPASARPRSSRCCSAKTRSPRSSSTCREDEIERLARRWRRSARSPHEHEREGPRGVPPDDRSPPSSSPGRPRLRAAASSIRTLGEQSAQRVHRPRPAVVPVDRRLHLAREGRPEQLSKFILGEHPQTIALILAHLNPGSAAQLITLLPDELRVDVLTRMASLDDISPDVVSRISTVIEQRLQHARRPEPRAARRRARGGRAVQPPRADRQRARCSRRSRRSGPSWRCRSAT